MLKKGFASTAIIAIIAIITTTGIGGYVYMKNRQLKPIGGETDSHGCLIAAGYSWCEPKQKCLRIWEEPCKEATTISPTSITTITTTTTTIKSKTITTSAAALSTTTTTLATLNNVATTSTTISSNTTTTTQSPTTTIQLSSTTITTVRTPFIDLTIGDIKVNNTELNNQSALVNIYQENIISITEKNIGQYLAESHGTTVIDDSNYLIFSKNIELENGDSHIFNVHYTCTTPGSHTLKIRVDYLNQVKEDNEDNNEKTIKLDCYRKCIDEEGKNEDVKGTVVYSEQAYTDSCIDPNHLREYYCYYDKVQEEVITCKNGYTCQDGMCKPCNCPNGYTCQDGTCRFSTPPTTIISSCTDSDEGKYNTKGTVTYNGQAYTDTCTYCTGICSANGSCRLSPGCGAVIEYYCENGVMKQGIQTCGSGSTCQNGACRPYEYSSAYVQILNGKRLPMATD